MSDVRAAAERLRQHDKVGWSGDDVKEYRNGSESVGRDWATLARAYLAEHPANDSLAIDEEWLRSVGFHQDPREVGDRLGCLETWPEFVDREGDRRWLIWNAENSKYVTIPRPLKPKTRGDVRRLAGALGITLKERN